VSLQGRGPGEFTVTGVKKVGVVGCGLMGSGIVQVAASAGYGVVVREVDRRLLDKGIARVDKFLSGAVEKGRVTEDDRRSTMERITGTLAQEDMRECDLVVEAATEDLELKRRVFAELDAICRPHAVLCTNTSSFSITELGGLTSRPDKFVGLHFFNPVPIMKLVEVVRGISTSDDTIRTSMEWVRSLGKHPILAQDGPGFVVNRLLIPYLLDAIRVLETGAAAREDIDEGMRLGCGYPMGPLTLVDFIGLDTTYYIATRMFEELKDARYAAPTLLKRMVAAGLLGRKTGRGFYDYTNC
jgi:3-hydroxybutyryl-CoA dehydrogenase